MLDCLKRWQSNHTCHHPYRFNELPTEKWNGKPRLKRVNGGSTCGCTAMNMPQWREMTEQVRWWAKQPSQVTCFSEDLKCWGAWDTKHKAKDITLLIAWQREAWKEEVLHNLSWEESQFSFVNQTNIGTISKGTLGKLLRDEVERIGAFFECIDTILNWLLLYSAILHSQADLLHSCRMWFRISDQLFIARFEYLPRWCTCSSVWMLHGGCYMELLLSCLDVCNKTVQPDV